MEVKERLEVAKKLPDGKNLPPGKTPRAGGVVLMQELGILPRLND